MRRFIMVVVLLCSATPAGAQEPLRQEARGVHLFAGLAGPGHVLAVMPAAALRFEQAVFRGTQAQIELGVGLDDSMVVCPDLGDLDCDTEPAGPRYLMLAAGLGSRVTTRVRTVLGAGAQHNGYRLGPLAYAGAEWRLTTRPLATALRARVVWHDGFAPQSEPSTRFEAMLGVGRVF